MTLVATHPLGMLTVLTAVAPLAGYFPARLTHRSDGGYAR